MRTSQQVHINDVKQAQEKIWGRWGTAAALTELAVSRQEGLRRKGYQAVRARLAPSRRMH